MGPTPYQERLIRAAARRYGIKPSHLAGQIEIESSWDENAVSSADAEGLSQFIPGTAEAYGVKYGSSKKAQKSQIFGQAHYLDDLGYEKGNKASQIKAYGGYYGMVDPAYTNPLYAASKDYRYLNKGGAGATPSVKSPSKLSKLTPTIGTSPLDDKRVQAFGMLADIGSTIEQPEGMQEMWETMESNALEDALMKSQRVAGKLRGGDGEGVKAEETGVSRPVGLGGKGSVDLAEGADRAGVPTSRSVIKFAKQLSGIAGIPVVIGTGSNHSKMTTSGYVSDHWGGNAADIPAYGDKLIRLGQAALIAAGMNPKQAHKINGGLFNVGSHQIIFNTQEGGDHTDHLHVSG